MAVRTQAQKSMDSRFRGHDGLLVRAHGLFVPS
jgi:hypothetical protein